MDPGHSQAPVQTTLIDSERIIILEHRLQEAEAEKLVFLSVSKEITSCRNRKDVEQLLNTKLAPYFRNHDLFISLKEPDGLTHKVCILHVSKQTEQRFKLIVGEELKFFINDGIFNVLEASKEPLIFDIAELLLRSDKPFYVDFWHGIGVKEFIGFGLRVNDESIGVIMLCPKQKGTFSADQLRLTQAISYYIGITLCNIRYYESVKAQLDEIKQYKTHLEQENRFLQEQISTTNSYNDIIGASHGLQKVFQLVSSVGPSDTTVLVQGETGTGKELIAQAIHNTSPRRNKLMVKVNCAALPQNLIESELFGHEKGSFTGASERRIGKFELANNSTLFLDEIGEIPLLLQAKLLRAIQEKEIERIGGNGVIKTNVRIVAATNRNLQHEVSAGRFRSDLFYRLNVFPISLPPLRERKVDIPALVSNFIQRYSGKSGRDIVDVSPAVVKELILYDWPGNVRELEHVIERSVLMTQGRTIKEVHLNPPDAAIIGQTRTKTLAENEREYILSVLKKCNGQVRGAAELLDLPPTTLHSKMKKLGIRKGVS